jgi:hypothetical protein
MNTIKISMLGFLGTLVSGFIFLGSAYLMVGLPAPFSSLFMMSLFYHKLMFHCVLTPLSY